MTITEFLEARIAEDEAAAREATQGHWVPGRFVDNRRYDRMGSEWKAERAAEESAMVRAGSVKGEHVAIVRSQSDRHFIALHNPDRVLAECAAKREIVQYVEAARADRHRSSEDDAQYRAAWWTATRLATVYADHPDYQQEWAC